MNRFIQNFNNLIKKIILKVKNKTNDKFQFITFNNLFKKKVFKVPTQINNKFQVSTFNKCLITFISLLFLYLFYLSIPVLYNKTLVQRNIEDKLLKEFNINFSTSSNISYRILPTPHFLFKDSKIYKGDNEQKTSLANIKNLKVFIGQNNFFNQNKIIVKKVKIDNANFLLLRKDLKLLKNSNNNKFSNKNIEINEGNIFFKDNSDETIAIIKISKAFLFHDNENLFNLFNLKGEAFNIPFNLIYKKKFNSLKSEEIDITFKKLKLKVFDVFNNEQNNPNSGKNIISFLNSTINTEYKIENNIVNFNSKGSRIKNVVIDYDGVLSVNPFDLSLKINIDNYKFFKTSNIITILNELIKTGLLFNENISVNTSIISNSKLKNKIFQNININFNIINGKINFNKTRLINKKIGSLELERSNLYLKNDTMILNTDIIIDINNYDELFSLLQTNKKFRKPIKSVRINIDYNFLINQITFNNIKVNNKKVSDELSRILEDFNDNNFDNWNKNKRLLNILFESYEGEG